MDTSSISLNDALAQTRTGDLWLFRGSSPADRAIRVATNAPVNHVGMAVVIEDLPPLMWHAELGRSLEDVWSGKHHRGVQLHNLHESVNTWHDRYEQEAWIRQLHAEVTPAMEDATLRMIARLDGTPFPSAARIAGRWVRGRARSQSSLETLFCAEVVAATYTEMGLLDPAVPENWYDPGRFWSGDSLPLVEGVTLGREISVVMDPAEPEPADEPGEQGARRRRDAAKAWWAEHGPALRRSRAARPQPEGEPLAAD